MRRGGVPRMFFQKNLTRKQQAQLLINLGESLNYGYSLNASLRAPIGHRYERAFRTHLQHQLRSGKRLHELLRAHRFPEEVASAIYFAERSGQLSKALLENGKAMQRKEKYVQSLRRVMRYPLFLVWMFGLVLYVIGKFLLPNFIQLYRSMSLELPAITKTMLSLANHLTELLVFGALFLLLLVISYVLSRRIDLLVRLQFAARLPVLSPFIQLYYTHQLSFQLSSLLRSGLSMKEAIHILSENRTSIFLKREANRLKEALTQGHTLSSILADVSYYLPELPMMIEQAAFQETLGDALHRYSIRLMDRMEQRSKWLLSLCQPTLLVVIGGLILLLFLSILLPVFQMINGL
ncbi:type II secretion system F family protein [Sporolactobacillus terrae]|uniref:Type II secretion system F family protein n=2 Tax=Sporolactobacillus terrae TaxID=269673 RepID=A0ABX5Q7X7_9BACL|nr:type II secretion system F family protein [Sporolactobacillus terrae]QAA25722.1 type II secretion system F family protein [Sporolactobacillus terrae]